MSKINNPFVMYGYKGEAYFCDRKQESNAIENILYNGNHVSVISPRRMGKTGLVHHVFERIRKSNPDIQCFYMDIYATKCLNDFVHQLARTVLGHLNTPLQNAEHYVSTFFRNTQLTLSTDVLTGLPQWGISFTNQQTERTLEQVFSYIAKSEQMCYIAIDEFQQICDYPEKNVEALLRTYVQQLSNVRFIFLGSKQHMMATMFNSPRHPFFKSAQQLDLKAIDERIYYEFVNSWLEKKGIVLSEQLFHDVYQRVDGTTWYVQAQMNMLYQHEAGVVTETTMQECLQEVIRLQESGFNKIYSLLTNTQAKVLSAIASEGCVSAPRSSAFLQKYELKSGSIDRALTYLMDNEYIYKKEEGYIVYDYFFGLWLK